MANNTYTITFGSDVKQFEVKTSDGGVTPAELSAIGAWVIHTMVYLSPQFHPGGFTPEQVAGILADLAKPENSTSIPNAKLGDLHAPTGGTQ